MNDVEFPVANVLHGIEVAHQVGLGPIRIIMVVKRGQNDQDIVAMARHFKGSLATDGHDLRALMRGGCSDEQLSTAMAHIWRQRTDRYSDLRGAKTRERQATGKKKIEMSYIGG